MEPQFKIHGQLRRQMKKELSLMKKDAGYFWEGYRLHKEMTFVYGGCCMTESEAEVRYSELTARIEVMAAQLAERDK